MCGHYASVAVLTHTRPYISDRGDKIYITFQRRITDIDLRKSAHQRSEGVREQEYAECEGCNGGVRDAESL